MLHKSLKATTKNENIELMAPAQRLYLNKCKTGYLRTLHTDKYITEHAHPCVMCNYIVHWQISYLKKKVMLYKHGLSKFQKVDFMLGSLTLSNERKS